MYFGCLRSFFFLNSAVSKTSHPPTLLSDKQSSQFTYTLIKNRMAERAEWTEVNREDTVRYEKENANPLSNPSWHLDIFFFK